METSVPEQWIVFHTAFEMSMLLPKRDTPSLQDGALICSTASSMEPLFDFVRDSEDVMASPLACVFCGASYIIHYQVTAQGMISPTGD